MGTEADLKLTLLCFTPIVYIFRKCTSSLFMIIAILCHFLSEKIVKYPLPGTMVLKCIRCL